MTTRHDDDPPIPQEPYHDDNEQERPNLSDQEDQVAAENTTDTVRWSTKKKRDIFNNIMYNSEVETNPFTYQLIKTKMTKDGDFVTRQQGRQDYPTTSLN